MIQIKRNNEIIITLSECPEGAVARYELMKEDYVSIKFSLEERIDLKIGDYAEIEGFKRYELVNPYSPAYNENTGGFDYDLRLDAYYYAWKNRIVRYIPNDSASETSFHLTSSVTTHLNVIINGLNGLGYNYKGEAYRYELRGYDKDLSVSKYKEYQNEDFISALSSLAELFECEWWVEQNTIFFGKLKDNNNPATFEVGNNVSSISAVENDGDFATRIIAFGSDRNIAATYRKNNSADVVVNGIVTKRLMLPLDKCPNGYVDRTETGSQAVEMVIVNENIYPRVECVTSEVLTDTIKSTDEEGKEIEQVIYRLKDKSGFNFSTEYILEGQELHILFVSGKMNGMDFECIYSDKDKYYEVVINENYGRALPDENLHPEIEDKFVIYGWDSSKIADTGIIDAAEEELYNYAVDILDGMQKDKKTYNCKMFSVYSEDYEQYDAGRKVNLVSPSFGERESRIIGYEIKLDIPNDSPVYIVGEYVKYTKTETLQKQIDSIVVNGVSYKGVQSGGGVTIITSSSSLTPSDSNVFSAKMSDKRYIRRDIDDETDTRLGAKQFVAKEKVVADRIKSKTEDAPVVVENDLNVEGNSSVEGEASIGGNATLKGGSNKIFGDVTFGKEGTETEHTEGVKGCKIYFNGSGWAIDTDYLSVNKRMYAKSIQVDEVDHVGGQIILTDASCVADKVAETEEYYRVYFRAKDGEGRKVYNQWRVGDQAYCQIFNIDKGDTEDFTNRYYWRLVVGVDSGDEFHYIDLSKSVCDLSGNLKMDNNAGTTPMPDDPIVQLGYRRQSGDDAEFVKQRQGATMISGGGRQGRSIRMWEKIDSFILPEPRVLISPSNVEMTLNKLHIKTTGDDEEVKDVLDYVQAFQEQFHIFELDTNEIPTLENEPYITWTDVEKVRYSIPPNNAVVINSDGRTWRFIVTDGVYSFEEFTDPWLLAQHKDLQTILDDNVIAADELITLIRLKTELEKESVEVESEKEAAKVDVTAAYNEWKIAFDLLKEVVDDLTAMNPPILLDGYKGELNGVSSPHSREELSGAFNNHTVALYKWQAALRDAGLDKVEGEIEQAAQDIYNIMSDNVVTADEVSRIITIKGEVVSEYAIAVSQKATLSDKQYDKVSETFDSMEDAYNALIVMFDAILAAETPIHLGTEEFSYTREGINTLYSNYAAGIYEWQSAYQKLFSDEALSDISKILDDNVITADEMLVFARLNNTLSSEKSSVTSQYNDAVAKAVIDTTPLISAYNNYTNAANGLMATLTGLINLDTPVYLKDYTGEKEGGSSADVSRADIEEIVTFHSSAYQKWVYAVADFNNEVNSALLEEILSDNIISANEKPTFIEMGKRIAQESVQEKNKYQAVTSPSTTLTNAYTNYTSAMTTLLTVLANIKNLTPPIHLKTDTEDGDIAYTRDELQALVVTYDVRLAAWRDAYEDFKRDKSSTDTLEEAKEYTNGEIDKILETTSKEYIDGLIKDFTEGKFASHSDLTATNEGLTAVYNYLGEDKDSIASSGLQVKLDKLYVGTSSVEFDENKKITNFSKAGLVTTTNFASVFAEETGKDGETVSAIISAFVDDGVSNITLTADNVFIESGSPALSNYFKVEYGNVTMQDVYCHDITVEGVINNLITTMSTWSVSSYGHYENTEKTLHFNPLTCGSNIIIDANLIDTFILPIAFHDTTGTVVEWKKSIYTDGSLQELRQCVGKRFWILSNEGNMLNFQSGTEGTKLLMWKSISFDGSATMDFQGITDEQEITERMQLIHSTAFSGDYRTFIIECKMGMYDGHECIYWELISTGAKLT